MRDLDLRTARASQKFQWLNAVKQTGVVNSLTRLDLWIAVDLINWLDDDLVCYRSYRDIAEAINCTENAAANGIARLKNAGFLYIPVIQKRAKKDHKGGRYATTYAIQFPRSFPNPELGNQKAVSPTPVGQTKEPQESSDSPSCIGQVSPTQIGPISVENPVEGGSALGRASASDNDVVPSEGQDETDLEEGGKAAAQPSASKPTASDNQNPETIFQGLNGDESWSAAKEWYRARYGNRIDALEHTQDLIDGFHPDDPESDARDGVVRVLRELLAGQSLSAGRAILEPHLAAAEAMLVANFGQGTFHAELVALCDGMLAGLADEEVRNVG
jgi:hypothetical protein